MQSAGFNAREIFVMDASQQKLPRQRLLHGLRKNKRVVFFDTLLKQLQTPEILAILAHELGHMKLKHIPKSMATSLALSFVRILAHGSALRTKLWFYNGHFIRMRCLRESCSFYSCRPSRCTRSGSHR